MKERPIIFSGPMVKAILEGRKTQTRRIVRRTIANRVTAVGSQRNFHVQDPHVVMACPYGRPGDRLWVRETWAPCGEIDNGPHAKRGYTYRADWDLEDDLQRDHQWKPAIFMPREASRITLKITGVRVERLQEITEEDAIAEGAFVAPTGIIKPDGTLTHRNEFVRLWQEINGKRAPWLSNPWVWVVEFRVL